MSFQFQKSDLNEQEGVAIKVISDNKICSYWEILQLWKTDKSFIEFWRKSILELGFEAVFWEVIPVTNKTLYKDFEFVILPAKPLIAVTPDVKTFEQHFNTTSSVVSFLNLGHDAKLIAPIPKNENNQFKNFAHLITFLQETDKETNEELWKTLAKAIESKINDQKLWVSTSGLGVYWLHIRLDSFPKYYQYQKYRK